jgi:hypothetical protein
MEQNTIVSPIGGFGNHLRWLMLLDSRFDFIEVVDVRNWSQNMYNDICGSDWPPYQENFHDMPLHTKQECVQLLPKHTLEIIYGGTNPEAKVKYILDQVYCSERSWFNWLLYEFKYREYFNKFILFTHDFVDINPFSNSILITMNEHNAYKHYLKFNATDSLSDRLRTTREFNAEANTHAQKHTVICGDILFDDVLDQDLYYTCINAFGLDDNYAHANVIHNAWFKLHKKSAYEFVNTVTELYKPY